MTPVTFGSVCSGIEAASVAWHVLGWRAAWLAEIEPSPANLLHRRYGSGRPLHMPDPDQLDADGNHLDQDTRDARRAAIKAVANLPLMTTGPRNLGDFTRIAAMVRAGQAAAPDVLVGGTPCQAFSIAGLRASLDDARGQLTLSFVDLANAIDTARHVRGQPAAVVVWENVPGVLSTNDNAFGCFLGALAGNDSPLVAPGGKWPNAGCVFGPQRTVAWRVLDAQYFGVAQRRRRVLVVASARNDVDPAAILFEFDGLRRDTAPRREAGQDPAAGTLRGTDGGSDVDHARGGHLQPVAATLDASYGRLQGCSGQDANHGHSHLVPIAFDSHQECVSSTEVFGALGSSSPQAQAVSYAIQAGALRTNPMSGPDGVGVQADVAYTLEARAEVQAVCLPFDTTQITSPTNRNNPQYGDPCHPLAAGAHPPAVCVTGDITHTLKAEGFDASEDGTGRGRGQPIVASVALRGREGGATAELGDDLAGTLRAGGGGDKAHALVNMAVRRLTPRECERLQGFPDFYTLVPVKQVKRERLASPKAHADDIPRYAEIDGQVWQLAADGPRYKAIGNSMCVTKMRWLGERIDTALRAANAPKPLELAHA